MRIFCRIAGGVRVIAFVAGGYLPDAVRGSINYANIAVADWYSPTILHLLTYLLRNYHASN